MSKSNEEVVVCSFAFILMSVASVAALFLTSEDETPPQVYIPPTQQQQAKGYMYNPTYTYDATPTATCPYSPRVDRRQVERAVQNYYDRQNLRKIRSGSLLKNCGNSY